MTKGVRKLRAAEASAGKQIVQEQHRDMEEELDGVDKATYDMNGVPEVSLMRMRQQDIFVITDNPDQRICTYTST